MSRHPKQDLLTVPVIRVDMEPPMGHEYWLSEQERLEANNGVYNFFARKAGAYRNNLDSKEYTLISRVNDQYPLTVKMVDSRRGDIVDVKALQISDFKIIHSLQDLLVRIVGLQDYYKHKSGIQYGVDRWTTNVESLPCDPIAPAPQTWEADKQIFKFAYENFKQKIVEFAKANNTGEIYSVSNYFILAAYNLQSYLLYLHGRCPFWLNPQYTAVAQNHLAPKDSFVDPNPPPPPPPMDPELVTHRKIIPGVPNPYSVPNDVPRPPPMPPLPIPAQDLNYAPVLPVGGTPQGVLPAGGDPGSNLPMYTVDPRMGYAGHSWYHPHPHPLRLIRPSRYWRY
jgi:hypothetical protein